jgi:hypothetical protein
MVKLISPRRVRTISGPRNRMLSAIAGFTARTGAFAYPKVAIASVMLWAKVNPLIVFKSIHLFLTMGSKPNTNSM